MKTSTVRLTSKHITDDSAITSVNQRWLAAAGRPAGLSQSVKTSLAELRKIRDCRVPDTSAEVSSVRKSLRDSSASFMARRLNTVRNSVSSIHNAMQSNKNSVTSISRYLIKQRMILKIARWLLRRVF